jgi:hypothetical protein
VLSGKRVERRESGSPGEFADLENMTASQLVEFIRKQAEESLSASAANSGSAARATSWSFRGV